jgi:hypothetical protein
MFDHVALLVFFDFGFESLAIEAFHIEKIVESEGVAVVHLGGDCPLAAFFKP